MAGRKRRVRVKPYLTKAYILEAMKFLRPPEDLTVSGWAEKYRMLDPKTSAIPGKWRNEKTPYLAEIMDSLLDHEIEETIFVKCTQVGGTEVLQNMLGYLIQQDPAPAMVVYPTEDLAESVSENRLEPMLGSSPELKKLYRKTRSTKLEKQFDGMYLTLAGSNSPSSLASKAVRYLFLDEVDKYPGASKKEADPISLARERTKTFTDRKIFMTSTPTLASGHIWRALEGADVVKHYFVPCPHCGEYIELKMSQVKFPDGEGMTYAERAELAAYACQECQGIITDREKPTMLRAGEWREIRNNGGKRRRVAYWINTLYSPFVRFSEIAEEFLESHDSPEKLQNFTNSWLAEPWEDTKLKTSADMVLERQTDTPEFVVPEWATLLTGGVDIQETCLYWTIRAWGPYMTSQNITHGQSLDFAGVENIMNTSYESEDGRKLVVDLCLIDSGYDTESAYNFCIDNSDWAIPVKGASSPMLGQYFKIGKVDKVTSRAYGMSLVFVDGDKYKDIIAAHMRKENGRGSWMVYAGCDREYAEQVTAEHKVNVRTNKKMAQKWEQKRSHAANHYLDTEVYAMAAGDIRGIRRMHLDMGSKKEGAASEEPYAPEQEWIKRNEGWLSNWR